MGCVVDIEDRRRLVRETLTLFPSVRHEVAAALGRDVADLLAWSDPKDIPTILELELLRAQLLGRS